MQNVSNAWKAAAKLDSTLWNVEIQIGDAIYTTFVEDPVIHRYGVPDNLFGGALVSILEFSILPTTTPAKAAQVKVYITRGRDDIEYISDEDNAKIQGDDNAVLVSKIGAATGSGIYLGTFYINTREPDEATGVVKFTCVDAMRLADLPYTDNQGTYPMSASNAVTYIANQMGVSKRSMTLSGTIDYPAGIYTMREILAYIAAMNGGNFIIDEDGYLKFVTLESAANTAVSDCVASSLTNNGKSMTISKVMLFPDSNAYVEAGTDSGDTVSADCIYATTSAVATQALGNLNGVTYKAKAAEIAVLDPAVQVGDTVEVSHEKFRLYNYDIILNRKIYFNISNPGNYELEQEFAFSDPATRQFDREIAKSYSEITKSIDEISLVVADLSTKLDNTVQLTASSYQFIKEPEATDYSPASITLSDANPKSGGTYAWYYGSDVISGATSSSYSVPRTKRSSPGSVVVRCVWTDSQGNTFNDEVSLVWLESGQIGNDGESFAWNLIHNTMEPDTTAYSTRPNINGYGQQVAGQYGYLQYGYGALTTAEHGVRATFTATPGGRQYLRFGASTYANAGLYGLVPGKQYTLSFDAACKLLSGTISNQTSYSLRGYLYCDSTSPGTAWNSSYSTSKTFISIPPASRGADLTAHCTWTFTVPTGSTRLYFVVQPNVTTKEYYAIGDYIEMANIMLQEGDKESPWSPAYDDMVGKDGEPGTQIEAVEYGVSSSDTTQPTTWSTSVPAVAQGQWLWCRTTYTDGTQSYTKSYASEDGMPGEDGYTIIADNDYFEVPLTLDTNGNEKPVTNGATYACNISVYKGITALTPTTSSTPSDGQFTLTIGQPYYRSASSTRVAALTASGPTVSGSNLVVTYTTDSSKTFTSSNGAAFSRLTIKVNQGGTTRSLYKTINISGNLNTVTKGYRSEIKQNADKIALVVEEVSGTNVIKTASIVTAINNSGSSIKLNADKIDLSGYVTISSLAGNGTTTINGNNITTGTIDARDVSITNINANNISSGYLSAGMISGSLSSSSVQLSGALTVYDSYGYTCGHLGSARSANSGESDGVSLTSSYGNSYVIATNSGARLTSNGYNLYVAYGGAYTNDPSLVTYDSDRRLKDNINYDLEQFDQFFDALKPCTFTRIDLPDKNTIHVGLIAQEVLDALDIAEIDGTQIVKEVPSVDEDGNAYLGLAAAEFTGLLIDQVQKLKNRVSTLEDQIASLTARLDALEG